MSVEWTKMEAVGMTQIVIDFVIQSEHGDIEFPVRVQRTSSISYDLRSGYQALKNVFEDCLETIEGRLHSAQSDPKSVAD